MSKVLKLLQSSREHNGCDCLKRMLNLKGENIDGCKIFEKILEENKENINFVFDHEQYHLEEYQKNGSKYGDFINKYYDEVTFAMCLGCLWHVISNYNDIPIGDKIFCYS
jgi:hypothetical protein